MPRYCSDCGEEVYRDEDHVCRDRGDYKRSRSGERREKSRRRSEHHRKDRDRAEDYTKSSEELLERLSDRFTEEVRLSNLEAKKNNDDLKAQIRDNHKELLGEVKKMDSRVTILEGKYSALEDQVRRLEGQGTSGSYQGDGEFVPTRIDIKGICEYKDRKTKGCTYQEAEAFVEDVCNSVPSDLAACIGKPTVKGIRVGKFGIPVKNGRAWEVRDRVKDKIDDEGINLGDTSTNIYVTLERSPEEQRRFVTAGRLIDAVKQLLKGRDLDVQIGWRRPTLPLLWRKGGEEHIMSEITSTAEVHFGNEESAAKSWGDMGLDRQEVMRLCRK